MRNSPFIVVLTLTLSIGMPGGLHCQEQKPLLYMAEVHYAKMEYALAIPLYQKLGEKRHPKILILRRLASSYAHTNAYGPAAKCYAQIVTQKDAGAADWLAYGNMLKCLSRYIEAKAAYGHCTEGPIRTLAAIAAAGADSALRWLQQPASWQIENLQGINTAYADWGAVAFVDSQIVFVSDSLRISALDPTARLNPKNYGWTNQPYQKLYVLDRDRNGQTGGMIRGFAAVMNKPEYHIGPVSFAPAWDTAWFTVTNPLKIGYHRDTLADKKKGSVVYYGQRRLELFYSAMDSNHQWQPPVAFPYNNADSFSVGHAALSPDGSILYFVSDRPGGHGKTDLWYVERRADRSWGSPQNCGPVINTTEEEEFPTMGADGTLYFSSKGHPGMGGFDLFRSSGDRNNWTEPMNMHPPLNSPSDDFYFAPKDSATGFFSSNRPGGKGEDDIYRYYGRIDSPVEVKTPPPVPDTAASEVPDLAKGVPDSLKQAPDTLGNDPNKVSEVPDSLNIRNIFYDFDKWNIRSDAAKTLDSLIVLMSRRPSIQLELSSYADARGSDGYNKKLSAKRAASVRAYLVRHGIASGRIGSRGYGKTKMVNGCVTNVACPESEHQRNRRTEFRIVYK